MRLVFKRLGFFIFILAMSQQSAHAWWFGKKKIKQSETPVITTSNDLAQAEENKKRCDVRVLLTEKKINEASFIIESKKGFHFMTLDGSIALKYDAKKIELGANEKQLLINGKKVAHQQFLIKPADGFLWYNNNEYEGYFLINLTNNYVELINVLDLEDYVCSVLNSESWPGWPLEINRAFAIACRSYVLHKMMNTSSKKMYHIKNTNIHQTYNGTHTSERLREAVNDTKGLVLTHNDKPIEAMFDCCCGGIIPAHIDGVDFQKAPYLARKQLCTFCKTSKIFGWRLEFTVKDFEELLRQAGYFIKNIRSISVTHRDKAGVVHKVAIKGTHNTFVHLTGKQLYALCSKIKSYAYKIEKKGSQILFSGTGYGHHMGICQWGARRMLDAGYLHRSILSFYYPGTQLKQFII